MTAYCWIKEDHRKRGNCWFLKPVDRARWATGIDAIATVTVRTEHYPRRRLVCRASYRWQSTGNKPEGSAEFASSAQAKRWVESQLAGFWEPPTIQDAPHPPP